MFEFLEKREHLTDDNQIKDFMPDPVDRVTIKFQASIGGPKTTLNKGVLREYTQSRLRNDAGFAKLGSSRGELGKLLKAGTQENNDIKAAITTALQLDPAMTQASTDYDQAYTDLETAVTNNPAIQAEVIASKLQEITSNAVDAIKDQHKKEIDKVNALFTANSSFVNNLLAIGLDQPDIDTLQQNMIATLKDNHSKQLKSFEDEAQKDVTAMHRHYDEKSAMIVALESFRKRKANQQQIEDLINQNRAGSAITASTSVTMSGDEYLNFDMSKLTQLETYTGSTLINQPDPNDPTKTTNSWSLQLGFFYPTDDLEGRFLSDVTEMAQLARASGTMPIEFTITDPDAETDNDGRIVLSAKGVEMARVAYFAALSANPPYPADQIQFNINGESMTPLKNVQKDKDGKVISETRGIFDKNPQQKQRYDTLAETKNNVNESYRTARGQAIKSNLNALLANNQPQTTTPTPGTPSPSTP